jgi:hypothetical protein
LTLAATGPKSEMIWSNLLHLSYNMWGDWPNPAVKGPFWCAQPYLRFDENLWNELLERMVTAGFNQVVIDVGDGVLFRSHPEISVENAWTPDKLHKELEKLRGMGLEPIPKLNFSTCHDQWLGKYSRMVSTPEYYKVCEDLIFETIDLFGKPRFFHLGMDEEEAQHQTAFEHVVLRRFDLWWRDFHFLRERVEIKGVRPWIWSDYVWNHSDVFYEKMPRSVVQSNWYREPLQGPAKSVYGGVFNMDIGCVKAYVDLDKQGFDQIPTVSNWETPENIYGTIRFCKEHLSPDKLLGFILTPWRPTLPQTRDRHIDAIDHFAKAKKEFDLQTV